MAQFLGMTILKSYILSIFGNCFPGLLQSGVTTYPLQMCGLANNRPQVVTFLLFYLFMNLSKLALLLRPLKFHAANHEAITFWCSVGVAGYLFIDSVLYLTLGNIYYCHPPTLKRYLELYHINIGSAMNKNESDIHVNVFHLTIDIILTVAFTGITIVNSFFQCKRNRVALIQPLRPVLQEFSNQRNLASVVSCQEQSDNIENQMQDPGQINGAKIQNTRSTEASSRFENQGSINLPSNDQDEFRPSRPSGHEESNREVTFSDAKSNPGPSKLYHQQTMYYRLEQSKLVTILQKGDKQIVKEISTNPGQEVILRPNGLLPGLQSCEEDSTSYSDVEEIIIIPDNSEPKSDKVSKESSANSQPNKKFSSTPALRESVDVDPTHHISEECSDNPQCNLNQSQPKSRVILCCKEISFSIILLLVFCIALVVHKLVSSSRKGYLSYPLLINIKIISIGQ